VESKKSNKSALARELGVSRSSLYYKPKKPDKDWLLKCEIEKVLRVYPSYGHKRLAIHLKINKKRILRVMKMFGIKPYRRRTKKYRKSKVNNDLKFDNLLMTNFPSCPNHIWASDFTHIKYQGKWVYLATIIDLFTRKVVGYSVMLNHSNQLTINALLNAVNKYPVPIILHSDQGSEYKSVDYTTLCRNLNIQQSMSKPGCPWENGYQESFYNQFKVDLGDPNRFSTLGELVYNIYKTIHTYNNYRIHSKLKMPPVEYGRQYIIKQLTEQVS
jgi:transposase InsO family protein